MEQSNTRLDRGTEEPTVEIAGRKLIRHEYGELREIEPSADDNLESSLVGLRHQLFRSKAVFFLFQQFAQFSHQLTECLRVSFQLDLLAQ